MKPVNWQSAPCSSRTSVAAGQTSMQPMRGKSAWPKVSRRWRVTVHRPSRLRTRKNPAMADMDDDELLAALGIEIPAPKDSSRTPREERIIAGFEDIIRFHQAHGRDPVHGQGREIFERLYAVSLEQLCKLPA